MATVWTGDEIDKLILLVKKYECTVYGKSIIQTTELNGIWNTSDIKIIDV